MANIHEYRLSRNIEVSMIDQLEVMLEEADWENIRIEKAFARVYEGTAPCLLIEVTNRPIKSVEIGSNDIFSDVDITVRFFGENDGQRADFTDWLTERFLELWDYYTVSIQTGQVFQKDLADSKMFRTFVVSKLLQ
mgnify:CR=1 FL=1